MMAFGMSRLPIRDPVNCSVSREHWGRGASGMNMVKWAARRGSRSEIIRALLFIEPA
jgi:hypothetical protein